MQNLIDFLIKYSKWLVFIFYIVVSCMLLFDRNPYQHYVYLTSANAVSSSLFGISNNVTSYFHLHEINEDLQLRNAMLENEVTMLRKQLRTVEETILEDSMRRMPAETQFDFRLAHVISNSVSRMHNYITIEKGSLDSIEPEMGVVDQNGVVGIVNVVGPHSSRVISLLNPKMRLSCKVKGRSDFGSLVWDCKNPHEALLEEMPRHERFKVGDTIVTSGYSSVFPEGIPVGTIMSHENAHNNNFYTLRIKLFTDFTTLSTVRVLRNSLSDELKAISAGEENE
ncbi:MAG: rod shape-determining protein MreC [Muribaculum sp.]|nr:rod shape-determining protein MreC [Muribaculaceae bacterium]MCM1080987.1 rod shape-determining protein MreC [Muribaculum sp.]